MKVNLTVPTELRDIKLKDYQKYMKIVQENEDATDFLNIKAVEVFCHVKIGDISNIKLKDFTDILNTITKALSQDKRFSQRFKLDGKEYGFIPKLDDMSIGEYIDLSKYVGEIENLHRAMAVMYRPIKQTIKDMYLIDEYKGSDELCDIMKGAPLDVVLGSQVFFYNLGTELLRHTMDYLEMKGEMNSQVKQILAENGDGIKAFTQSLQEIYTDLEIHLN